MINKKKFHFIYKITCIITRKYYIGMHSTDILEDGYIGSGKVLKRSILKYGKENHIREILYEFSDRESLAIKEKELVNESLINDILCMNLKIGGEGGGIRQSDEVIEIIRQKNTGQKRSLETRKKISEACKNRSKESRMKHAEKVRGLKHSDETKKQISDSCKGLIKSEETKKKMSDWQKGEKSPEFGKRWIFCPINKIKQRVRKEEVDAWLEKGWQKGRKIYFDGEENEKICSKSRFENS